MIRVGTDGGCYPNPGGPGGWAWVAEDGRYGCGSFASGTNNVAELLAMREALLAFPDEPLTIEYDSQYAANSVTKWGRKWIREGDTKRANFDLVREIIGVIDARVHKVVFEYVRGHDANNAHPLNTHADELATRMRKVGHESRETGFLDVDWSEKVVARGRPRTTKKEQTKARRRDRQDEAPAWGNFTAVGEVAGMTAHKVGEALREMGLYAGGSPTQKAIREKLVQSRRSERFKVDFYLWHISLTAERIQQDR